MVAYVYCTHSYEEEYNNACYMYKLKNIMLISYTVFENCSKPVRITKVAGNATM